MSEQLVHRSPCGLEGCCICDPTKPGNFTLIPEVTSLERPLYVRVAEALGWQWSADGKSWSDPNGGRWAALGGECRVYPIPRYDTDWAATGPLIERFFIVLIAYHEGNLAWMAGHDPVGYWGPSGPSWEDEAMGSTPLIAVCNLILALNAAGKLPK